MLKQVENIIAWGKERVAIKPESKKKLLTESAVSEMTDELEPEGVDQRLATVRFRVDSHAHIQVNNEVCKECSTQACVYVCPANLFTPLSDGTILFNYEQCFECGTCYVACNREGAITWTYPKGGYGVSFREA